MAGEGIIQLYSGRMFNVRQPRPQDIIFEDVSISLSRLARFNGHSELFYSVAQHSVLVALLVPIVCASQNEKMTPDEVLDCQRRALMHDAHEAYIGDIPRPLKMFCTKLWDLVPAIDAAIASRFGLISADGYHEVIRRADRLALAAERRDVLGHQPSWLDDPGQACAELSVRPVGHRDALFMFRLMFDRLWGIGQTRGPYDRREDRSEELGSIVSQAFPVVATPEAKA